MTYVKVDMTLKKENRPNLSDINNKKYRKKIISFNQNVFLISHLTLSWFDRV